MSSSSDEDLSKFREATDTKLYNNSLFSEDKGDHSAIVPVKSSLRYLDAPDENRTDLKVTPGFQKHVASHLMKILDSSLDQNPLLPEPTSTPEHDSNGNCTSDLPRKVPEGGIKLFGASAAFLASCNITPPTPAKRRKRGRKVALMSSGSEDESSSNEADICNLSNKDDPENATKLGAHDELDLSSRFAACAVSSDWILNGEATKGWAPPFKIKEPIEGEATPDLIKMTAALASICVRHKKKKKKERSDTAEVCETGATEPGRKRGKRGAGRRKIMLIEVVEDENFRDYAYKPPKHKQKKKKKETGESSGEELMNEEELHEHRLSRALYKEFRRSVAKETNQENAAEVEEPSKKRKKNKRGSLTSTLALVDQPRNIILKKMKKEKRRKELENELHMPVLEDEGFDSDPTKADKKRREQRKLLKAQIKKERKKARKRAKKKWQKNMEFLSNDLANLMMTPVKED